MRQSGTESKPSLFVGLGIAEVNQPLSVDIISHMMPVANESDMIPVVRFQQVCLVGIFLQDGWPLGSICDASLIAVVSAEAGSRVMVAAIAHIVEPQGIAVQEHSPTLFHSMENIIRIFRVAGHPEAVQVAQPVGRLIVSFLHHHAGIIFYRDAPLHLLLTPKRQSLWRNDISRIAPERHPIVSRFRLHHPVLRKLLLVQC